MLTNKRWPLVSSLCVVVRQTLYTVETSVVPPPGMNLCSAGSLCDLLVDIQQLTATTPATGLYYQVQSDHYWAVCDSTAAGKPSLENTFKWMFKRWWNFKWKVGLKLQVWNKIGMYVWCWHWLNLIIK